jgi:hypothetical protein
MLRLRLPEPNESLVLHALKLKDDYLAIFEMEKGVVVSSEVIFVRHYRNLEPNPVPIRLSERLLQEVTYRIPHCEHSQGVIGKWLRSRDSVCRIPMRTYATSKEAAAPLAHRRSTDLATSSEDLHDLVLHVHILT